MCFWGDVNLSDLRLYIKSWFWLARGLILGILLLVKESPSKILIIDDETDLIEVLQKTLDF